MPPSIVLGKCYRQFWQQTRAYPSYRTIMQAFQDTRRKPAMIGLTATPFRQEYSATDPHAGTRELRELFQQVIEPLDTLGENPRAKLEADGFLARPIWSEIKTATLLMAPPIPDAEHITEDDIEKIDYAVNAPPAKAGGAFTLE